MNGYLVIISVISYLYSVRVAIGEHVSDCEENEVYKEHYFTILENNQDLMQLNNKIYLGLSFDKPSWIRGWDVKGRTGPVEGDVSDRGGLVLTYFTKYRNNQGSWVPIESPKSNKDIFVNNGNIAAPDIVTKVSLKQPIRTQELRFFPEMWDGCPFMGVRVRFCGGKVVEEPKVEVAGKPKTSPASNQLKSIIHLRRGGKNIRSRVKKNKTSRRKGKHRSKKEEEEEEEEEEDEDEEEEEEDDYRDGQVTVKEKLPDSDDCKTKVTWRYSGRHEHQDVFSSSSRTSQSYKAQYSHRDEPYQFSLHRKQFIQILFAGLTRVYEIKTVGKRTGFDWGGVRQFSLVYRDVAGQWEYYTDTRGNKRIFDVGSSDKQAVVTPEEFQLPRPLDSRMLRLYPHKWTGYPYLSLDIKACYLENPNPSIDDCSSSLLSKDKSLVSIKFNDLPNRRPLNNYKNYHNIQLDPDGDTVLVTGVKGRLGSDKVKADNIVQSFVLQYLGDDLEWWTIVDDDGVVKIFKFPTQHFSAPITFPLPIPVETAYLRIYPERWKGKNPELFLDVLGCSSLE